MIRNITLDYTKIALSLLVIMIHCPILLNYEVISNTITNGICRIAVPSFFVINGLYIEKIINSKSNLINYLNRLFKVYLVWMVIYAPFYLFFFKDTIEKSILINILTLLFGYWHLWYLTGLMGGVYLLYYLKRKRVSIKVIILFSFILFFTGWCMQKIELFFPNEQGVIGSIIRNIPVRNFVFMGLPFIAIGYAMSNNNFIFTSKKWLKNKYVLIFLFLTLIIESNINYYYVGKTGFDFFLSLFILCPILVQHILNNSKNAEVESDFISKLSSAIYFIHPLIIFLLNDIFVNYSNNKLYILVILFSLLFGTSLINLNKKINIFL